MRATPQRLWEMPLSDLAPGESAYVSPAALFIAPDRSCHILTDMPVRRNPDATATMHVRRTAAGYIADITCCDYQWAPTDWAECQPNAPVCRLVFGDEFLR